MDDMITDAVSRESISSWSSTLSGSGVSASSILIDFPLNLRNYVVGERSSPSNRSD